ncbi:MAG: polymer-forming cytoskeletal protein [Bacillota bacterium]|nr:MAG: cell shape determination protein CcmA [Bacillota bacterium]
MFRKRAGETLRYSRIDTVLGEGTVIRGDLQSTGVVRIDGTLEGQVDHDGILLVGPKGRVIANVRARGMSVAGEVHGDVDVEGTLELLSGAVLRGDIRCAHLVIHEGAVFEGRCHMHEAGIQAAGGGASAGAGTPAGTGTPAPESPQA